MIIVHTENTMVRLLYVLTIVFEREPHYRRSNLSLSQGVELLKVYKELSVVVNLLFYRAFHFMLHCLTVLLVLFLLY